jgi:hypothetical protein
METKNKIGTLLVLGGIALLGVYYFKKNKPTIASTQLEGLEALSNYYESGVGANEETYIKGTAYVAPKSQSILNLVPLDFTNLTPKQSEDLNKFLSTVPDPTKFITDQIEQNLENKDFGNQYMSWGGLNFDNIKLP